MKYTSNIKGFCCSVTVLVETPYQHEVLVCKDLERSGTHLYDHRVVQEFEHPYGDECPVYVTHRTFPDDWRLLFALQTMTSAGGPCYIPVVYVQPGYEQQITFRDIDEYLAHQYDEYRQGCVGLGAWMKMVGR